MTLRNTPIDLTRAADSRRHIFVLHDVRCVGTVTVTQGPKIAHPSRRAVQTVACPLCRAAAGRSCTGKQAQPREANHKSRVLAYRRTTSQTM